MQEPDKQEPAQQENVASHENSQSASDQSPEVSKQQAQGQSVAGNAMASYSYEPPAAALQNSSTSSPKGKEKPKGLMKILTKLAAGITVVGCIILIIAVTVVSNLMKGLTDAIQSAGQRSTK